MLRDLISFVRRSRDQRIRTDLRTGHSRRRFAFSSLRLEALECRLPLAAYIPISNTNEIWVDTGDSSHPQDIVPRFVRPSDDAIDLPSGTTFNWSNTGTWSDNGSNLPGSTSKVRVASGKTLVVDVSTAVVGDVEVQSGGTLKLVFSECLQ